MFKEKNYDMPNVKGGLKKTTYRKIGSCCFKFFVSFIERKYQVSMIEFGS